MRKIKSYVEGLREITFNLAPSGKLKLQICSDNVIRVVYSPKTFPLEDESLTIVKRNLKPTDWRLEKKDEEVFVITDRVIAAVNFNSGLIEFKDSSEKLILKENFRKAIPVKVAGEKTYHVEQIFSVSENEGFYGLGQHPGIFNYRGHTITLIQRNWDVAIPFLVSSKGYGILWDNYSMTRITSFRDGGRISSDGGLKWPKL